MLRKFLAGSAVTAFLLTANPIPNPARASELIDRSAENITLQVNERDEALISYVSHGEERHVLAWGAVNAVAPTNGGRQVKFQLDYSGGWKKYYLDDLNVKALRTKYQQLKESGQPYLDSPVVKELSAKSSFARNYWKDSFEGSCAKYNGPKLAWFVTACKAPDGSYWAIQSWQRGLPSFGKEANFIQGGQEIRISHWRGGLPTLEVNLDWSYKSFHHLYGRLVYQGRGVKGLGPNIYVDTYNSKYGSGWRRENGFVTHQPNGTFCYGFSPHGDFPSGEGERYRVTALGPGVTPDVLWEGASPGSYNREVDLADLERQKQFLAGDNVCKPR